MAVYLWSAIGIIWVVLAVLNAQQDHPWMTGMYAVGAVGYGFLAWGTTRAHTDVNADGVRVSNGLGGKQVAWDAIDSVSTAGLWHSNRMVTFKTQAGKSVGTHIPSEKRPEFIAYANAHRSPTSPDLT